MILQLKANASSVPTDQGGGSLVYVCIIISPANYATLVSMTPFVPPVNPGVLHVASLATQYQIALAKIQHEEALKYFAKYQLVQRGLIQHVLEVIDHKYLTHLRNRVTGQVPKDIRELLVSLFRIYSKITANQLKDKYDDVYTMSYDIVDPIDVILNDADDLRKISKLSQRPYTPHQIADIGYIIISKLPIFRLDVRC